jgi:hypothetical protein
VKPPALRHTALALALVGCGLRGVAPVDGGDGSAPLTGRRSFDLVAALGDAAVKANLQPTVDFTLVLDADAGSAIVGGRGNAAIVAYTSKDGRRFTITSRNIVNTVFSVGLPSSGQCAAASSLDFTLLDVTVSGATLSGQAKGSARISCGDCQFDVPFGGPVTGVADATPPLLFPTTIPANPFQQFSLSASEPLPTTAKARLVGSDGSSFDLQPMVVPGDIPVVAIFTKPSVVLSPNTEFEVDLGGLVDFAGLSGPADTPLRFAAFPAMPLVAPDGFESATGAELGGATVISGGPLPPISGAYSVYFGAQGAPAPGGVHVGSALRVRLAVPPGATKVSFSYRMVGQYAGSGFAGTINVGSVGHTPGSDTFTTTPNGTPTTWPDGQTVYITDVATKEVSLPADATSEILLVIEPFGFGCGGPMPPAGGMLLDDLRVE